MGNLTNSNQAYTNEDAVSLNKPEQKWVSFSMTRWTTTHDSREHFTEIAQRPDHRQSWSVCKHTLLAPCACNHCKRINVPADNLCCRLISISSPPSPSSSLYIADQSDVNVRESEFWDGHDRTDASRHLPITPAHCRSTSRHGRSWGSKEVDEVLQAGGWDDAPSAPRADNVWRDLCLLATARAPTPCCIRLRSQWLVWGC